MMNQAAKLAKEEEALGNWPRRLLHVPSMRSLEWKRGNKYGTFVAPAYNVITYTWGRFRLNDGEMPNIKAVDIKGTPWKIPRVRPSHFTANQFLAVIQSTMRTLIEFLWLDVACIDQRESVPECHGTLQKSAAEIGRQAAIFRGATHTFIWLTARPAKALQLNLDDLRQATETLSTTDINSDVAKNSIVNIHRCFQQLFSDPWFSSLWTLQEAWLGHSGIFMSQDGQSHEFSGTDNVTLYVVMQWCDALYLNHAEEDGFSGPHRQAIELYQKTGLKAIASGNALAVYVASALRKASLDQDRIYGIQQVFQLRVGNSDIKAPPGVKYTRAELEDQLGRLLLNKYPVQSQLFIHKSPAPKGRAWFVNQKSLFVASYDADGIPYPSWDGLLGPRVKKPMCILSTKKIDSTTWGTFDGRLCKFSDLNAACRRLEAFLFDRNKEGVGQILMLALDNTDELQNIPGYQSGEPIIPKLSSNTEAHNVASWLAEDSIPSKQGGIVVLLLGPHELFEDCAAMIGLILSYHDTAAFTYYHRLGFCWWSLFAFSVFEDPLKEKDIELDYRFLEGQGRLWDTTQGIFG
ncbi:hypothetical protein F4680DRAFT_463645 [Xylaria scruposa]|nr:hypothetical protein F4680DRAFT_463645 [Xylaria scruposa]